MGTSGEYARSGALTFLVGAGLPTKNVNDNAGCLMPRVALGFFAGKPAPTRVVSTLRAGP
ncbi:hypothetical protein FJD34_08510 [Pseudomonas brenneri]|uniref:Uncharacterized protein n=1 Tax=Pseudomonas brenneri TaxID=129817 RepID=A0A5B2UWM3_9PSED|nr:hypothetical protein [Pseudomonas brenneri]KAA2231094.1 hypothetical protein F1720_09100 [Pseudomonas brenneri]TWR80315.1 hypothetical protein FJD34_08510 [Pseudomonas brenneri]